MNDSPNAWTDVPLGPTGAGNNENKIEYGDIVRYNVVSQFQQMMANQTPMTHQEIQRYLTRERFQYGVNQERDWRSHNRQVELQRMAYGAGIVSTAADFGTWGAASAAVTAIGVGGLMGMALPFAIAAVPMNFINNGIQKTLERQKYMQSMSSDIETYRERLGMPRMTFDEATQAGFNITQKAYQRDQFFNPQQQQNIIKTALANDMLSGKTKGMVQGNIQQFEKNVNDLLETTKAVVKMLNTTTNGGLSLIKEMQQQGFGNIAQIKASITAAQGYGALTGIGTQNMLQIGAAGAAAVRGTSWSAAAGAGLYQAGAAYAGGLAMGNNAATQQAVMMAGGVAQAGAGIAAMNMNIAKSTMGNRTMAFMMNAQGGIDYTKLDRLAHGGVSGYEITTGAAANVASWGPGGRVMFKRRAGEAWNRLAENDPAMQMRLIQTDFAAWGANRYGTVEQKAQAFSEAFAGGNQELANVYADLLTNGPQFGNMAASKFVSTAVGAAAGRQPSVLRRWGRAAYWGGPMGGLERFGAEAALAAGTTADVIAAGTGYVKRAGLSMLDAILSPIVPGGMATGVFNLSQRGIGSYESALNRMYGVGSRVTAEGMKTWDSLSISARNNLGRVADFGPTSFNAVNAMRTMGNANLRSLIEGMTTAAGNGRAAEFFADPTYRSLLGLDRRTNSWEYNKIMANPVSALQKYQQLMGSGWTSISKQADQANDDWQNYQKLKGNIGREGEFESIARTARLMDMPTAQKYLNMNLSNSNLHISKYDRELAMAVQANAGGIDRLSVGSKIFTLNQVNAEGWETEAKAKTDAIFNKSKFKGTDWFAKLQRTIGKYGGKESWQAKFGINSLSTIDATISLMDKLNEGGLNQKQVNDLAYRFNLAGKDGNYGGSLNALYESINKATTITTDTGQSLNLRQQREAMRIKEKATGMQNRDFRMLSGTVKDAAGNVLTDEVLNQGLKTFYNSAMSTADIASPAAKAAILAELGSSVDVAGLAKTGKLRERLFMADDKRTIATREQMIQNQLRDLIRSTDTKTRVQLHTGDPALDTKDTYAPEKAKEILRNELDNTRQQRVTEAEMATAGGRGLNAQINPPVLNYWNNQWAL